MALRNLIYDGDSRLLKKSRPVEKFDERIHTLLDDMAQTMYDQNGAGLAAVQVGILRRAFVVDASEDRTGLLYVVNPEIISTQGEQTGREGCLSYPGEVGIVTRPMVVTFRAQDSYGKFYLKTVTGLFARAVLHENDHLNGIVFKDLATEIIDLDREE